MSNPELVNIQGSASFSPEVSKALRAHDVVGDAYHVAVENWARLKADPTTGPADVATADAAAKGAFEEMWRVDRRDAAALADVPLEAWPNRVLPITPRVPGEQSSPGETYQPNWVIIRHSEERRSRLTVRGLGSLVVSKVMHTMNRLRRGK